MSEYFFVCSGNKSIISSLYDLIRTNVPGVSVGQFEADVSSLQDKSLQLQDTSFGGKQFLGMGKEVGESQSIGAILAAMTAHASQDVHIFYTKLDGEMIVRMHMIYGELLKQAIGQGILPFPMFTTRDFKADQTIMDSLTKVS